MHRRVRRVLGHLFWMSLGAYFALQMMGTVNAWWPPFVILFAYWFFLMRKTKH